METVEAVVVGAGVVGLAVARSLALQGREVVLLERAGLIGSETSSRNSEVIHAGLYYPPGSIKARLCVESKERLYRYCAERGVGHRRCEKIVVASEKEQLGALQALAERSAQNGVEVRLLNAAEAREMEPELLCAGALLSPSTGIIDSHGLMLAYLGEMEAAGGFLALNTPLEAAAVEDGGFLLETGGESPMTLKCRYLVNSAGLYAEQTARRIQGLDPRFVPTTRFAKGNYFMLQGASPFRRLVYPMPAEGVLGIHITLDMGGRARFGPDLEWVERPDDYSLDASRAERFYEAVRSYWPGLEDGALEPGYCGIRPKLHGPGEPQPDFVIQGPATHGVAGLVNLFGIESPGLTSSLSLGDWVRDLLAA